MSRFVNAIALLVLATLVLAALSAGLVSKLIGFDYDEIHLESRNGLRGVWSVPAVFPERVENQSWFEMIDANGDGRIECRNVRGRCNELLRGDLLRMEILMSWFDRDDPDSSLSCVQWDQIINEQCTLPSCRELWCDRIDKDGNSQMERREMVQALAPLSLRYPEMNAADANRDGFIAQSEFPGFPTPRQHYLGTDALGRDRLVRLLFGLRITLLVALAAALVSTLLGTVLGLASGVIGGWVDRTFLRFLEVLQSVPFIVVVILLSLLAREFALSVSLRGQQSAFLQVMVLFLALGAVQWFSLARYARGLASDLMEAPFVKAMVGMGYGLPTVLFRHVLPNSTLPILAFASLLVPTVVLEEAFLSFLGFGVQPPYPSLGVLLNDGVGWMRYDATALWIPMGVLVLLSWSLFVLGDSWRKRSVGRTGGNP